MRNVILIGLLSLLASCASRPAEPLGRHGGWVQHVVVCWLKTPGDATARQTVIDESHALGEAIPGLMFVAAGTVLPSDRPGIDSSFDVAIYMAFYDEQALRAYESHPRHKQALEQVLRPLVDKVVIYDSLVVEPKALTRARECARR